MIHEDVWELDGHGPSKTLQLNQFWSDLASQPLQTFLGLIGNHSSRIVWFRMGQIWYNFSLHYIFNVFKGIPMHYAITNKNFWLNFVAWKPLVPLG